MRWYGWDREGLGMGGGGGRCGGMGGGGDREGVGLDAVIWVS